MSKITRQIGKASRPSKGLMVVRVRPRTRVISHKSERASNASLRSARKPIAAPERVGLIYAVPGVDVPLAEEGLFGFASVQMGEHFLGNGILIATVQTLNISQKLTGTLLGGKVALRLVHAVHHCANTLGCARVMVHVTNGENAEDADWIFRRCGPVTVR